MKATEASVFSSCSGYAHHGRMGSLRCPNKGKLFEDDKWWCAVHAPSKVEARHAKIDKRYAAEWDLRSKRINLDAARRILLKRISRYGLPLECDRRIRMAVNNVLKAEQLLQAAINKSKENHK